MRNAIAAVAAADNWRNALREPFESISVLFIPPSSNVRIFSMNKVLLPYFGRKNAGIGPPSLGLTITSNQGMILAPVVSDPDWHMPPDFGLPGKSNLMMKIG
jgi:hypothetical protein